MGRFDIAIARRTCTAACVDNLANLGKQPVEPFYARTSEVSNGLFGQGTLFALANRSPIEGQSHVSTAAEGTVLAAQRTAGGEGGGVLGPEGADAAAEWGFGALLPAAGIG